MYALEGDFEFISYADVFRIYKYYRLFDMYDLKSGLRKYRVQIGKFKTKNLDEYNGTFFNAEKDIITNIVD